MGALLASLVGKMGALMNPPTQVYRYKWATVRDGHSGPLEVIHVRFTIKERRKGLQR